MPDNLIKRCMLATQRSLPATLVLLRIAYWWPRTTILRDEKRWIARTRSDWMDETELSEKQVKEAFAHLRHQLLIETRTGKWGGGLVGFVTLTDRGQTVVFETPKTPDTETLQGPTVWSLQGPNLNQGDYIKVSYDTSYLQKQPPLNPPSGESAMPTVQEMLAQGFPQKKKSDKQPLAIYWQDTLAKATDKFIPPATIKEKGQLALLERRCYPYDVRVLIQIVLADWHEFTGAVKSAKDQKSAPSQPHLDYLLVNVAEAVAFSKAGIKTAAQNVGHSSESVKSSSPIATPTPEAEQAATVDEVEAILGVKVKKG